MCLIMQKLKECMNFSFHKLNISAHTEGKKEACFAQIIIFVLFCDVLA
jgi:hypothetical protein